MGLFSSSTQSRLAAAEPAPISGPLIAMRSLEKVFETPAGRMYVLRRITVDVQAGEFPETLRVVTAITNGDMDFELTRILGDRL